MRPGLKAELIGDYEAYVASMGVLQTPLDFDVSQQFARNLVGKLLERNRARLLGALWMLVLGGFGIWVAARALRR